MRSLKGAKRIKCGSGQRWAGLRMFKGITFDQGSKTWRAGAVVWRWFRTWKFCFQDLGTFFRILA